MSITHAKVSAIPDGADAAKVQPSDWNDDHVVALDVLDLPTAETDPALVLAPDGAGGVEFRAETGGGGGGFTHAYLGYNTVGGSLENVTSTRVLAKKVTVAADGILVSIGAHVKITTDNVWTMAVALYSDSAGTPNQVIAYSAQPATTVLLDSASAPTSSLRWLHVPVGRFVAAGDYWIAVQLTGSGTLQLAYDGSGSDRYYSPGSAWFADWGRYSPSTSSNKYSIRASIIS